MRSFGATSSRPARGLSRSGRVCAGPVDVVRRFGRTSAHVQAEECAVLVELARADRLAFDDSPEPNASNEKQVISNQLLVPEVVRALTVARVVRATRKGNELEEDAATAARVGARSRRPVSASVPSFVPASARVLGARQETGFGSRVTGLQTHPDAGLRPAPSFARFRRRSWAPLRGRRV